MTKKLARETDPTAPIPKHEQLFKCPVLLCGAFGRLTERVNGMCARCARGEPIEPRKWERPMDEQQESTPQDCSDDSNQGPTATGWAYADEEDSDAFRPADTREEAIKEGLAFFEGENFWIATTRPVDLSLFDGDHLADELYGLNTPPEGDEWIHDLTEDQKTELANEVNDVIRGFLVRNDMMPRWSEIAETIQIDGDGKEVPAGTVKPDEPDEPTEQDAD